MLGEFVFLYVMFNEFFCSVYLGYEIGVYVLGRMGRKYGRIVVYYILLVYGFGMKVFRKNVLNSEVGIVLNFMLCYFVI